MIKKLLTLLTAFCLIVPALLVLTACKNDAHTHVFDEKWETDANRHWHVCTGEGCEETDGAADHAWNGGVITTPATSAAAGVKTYTCTICGYTKTEEVAHIPSKTVTAEQWSKALAFEGIDNYSMSSTVLGNTEFSSYYIVDGAKIYTKQGNLEYYFEAVGSGTNIKYYQYQHTDAGWTRTEIDADDYNVIHSGVSQSLYQYDKFTYNAETEKYEATDYEAAGGACLKKVTFEFEDGRLIEISMTTEEMAMNQTISYETNKLTVPTLFTDAATGQTNE